VRPEEQDARAHTRSDRSIVEGGGGIKVVFFLLLSRVNSDDDDACACYVLCIYVSDERGTGVSVDGSGVCCEMQMTHVIFPGAITTKVKKDERT